MLIMTGKKIKTIQVRTSWDNKARNSHLREVHFIQLLQWTRKVLLPTCSIFRHSSTIWPFHSVLDLDLVFDTFRFPYITVKLSVSFCSPGPRLLLHGLSSFP